MSPQSQRLQRQNSKEQLRWRMASCYALFQILNIVNMLLAVLISACVLAFVLAMRGQTISHLLPWFLFMAVPVWILASYWLYSLLIRRGVLNMKAKANAGMPANDAAIADDASANESSAQAEQAPTPLRRLFSL